MPAELAAPAPDPDTLSEFAQLVQQIAGGPVNPQDAQAKTAPMQDAALPARHLTPNQSGAAPAPAPPPVLSARQGAKPEPAPAKPVKNVISTDPGTVAVEIEWATPVMQPSAPLPLQTPVAAESPESIAQEMKPVGRSPSPVNEMTPAVQPDQAPEAVPPIHAAGKQLAADQPTPSRPDQATPRAEEASTRMDVSSAAPETDASPSPLLAKSPAVAALLKPSLRMPVTPTPAIRQMKPAAPEIKPTRRAPDAASTDVPLTVQPPAFVAPPAAPPATPPELARHDTPVSSMPGVQRDAKPDPGPAAVELKIRPQDQPVDRIAPQMRAEPLVNSATTAPALHTAEVTPAPAQIMQSYANPNIVGVTPPVMPQNPVAKPEAPLVTATRIADVLPDQPKQPATPLRSISIDFVPDGAQDVHVRLAERAGDVHVSLHSVDSAFAGRLADGVQDLVGTLANAGYDAQAWTSGQERQNQGQQEQPQQKPDDTDEGSEEFSAMMQQPNEEVS
jgi:hypothetical protein